MRSSHWLQDIAVFFLVPFASASADDLGEPTTIHIQAIRVADDDGNRRTPIVPDEVQAWVDFANETYSTTGIRFDFNAEEGDFTDLNSTILNSMTGVWDANWREARQLGNSIAATHPGKIVCFFRWGPDDWPTGGGFSWWDYNFIAMPGFEHTRVCGQQNITVLAHEVGHYLGLPHPFTAVFDTVSEAEDYFIGHGSDPFMFDGDGLADTLPDPFVSSLQCAPPSSLILDDHLFLLQPENIMSYWGSPWKTLTVNQSDRARWMLSLRRPRGMAMPVNFGVRGPLEFDSMPVQDWSYLGYHHQAMAGFGLDPFSGGRSVNDQTALDVTVQLSPIMAGSVDRCITFELYADCVQAPLVFTQDMHFGGLRDLVGHFTDSIKIPSAGQWVCITARDQLHSLRSTDLLTCDGGVYSAVFKGDPLFGGNWLIGGNLDGWKKDNPAASHDVIDILDFGQFVAQYGWMDAGDTPCGTEGPHADVNGDGVVDGLDFAFVSMNFLSSSKAACCGEAAARTPARTEISVRELRQMGMADLAVADLNGDGLVNTDDMAAFMAGEEPNKGQIRRHQGSRPRGK